MGMSTGSNEEVILQTVKDKGVITLNRPKQLNTLNLSMVRKIYPMLKTWEADPRITMVLIKGVGEKAFCAGGDVKAITDSAKAGDYSYPFFGEEYVLNNTIGTLHIPYIALIDGITMGGGVGLSVHGSFRVATERSVFAMPEMAIGLFPDVGGGHFLPRLGGKLGLYLALTGYRLKGIDVQKAGVATHFVEAKMLDSLEKELLDLDDPGATDISKVLDHYHDQSKLDAEKEFHLQPHMEKINTLFAGDSMEQIFADLEADGSEWSLAQLAILKKMSPLSMKVAFRQLSEGATKSLQAELETEFRIGKHMLRNDDFHEGVRAVLVDKDNKPKWQHSCLEAVSPETVAKFFAPLPEAEELML
ncbi:PREDICTED: 3-hydroxyisobutyryl-CoA hydrolase, mitochondrial-like [Priapulus caudatus]|uniref:3-hydroxyisobutyryl-CoA hydrolase, mitochondrial n=1 Tax=Priapulus caudatus TaxID=37621 RepID=A0ABM1ETM7_PRICU|nr:PREDICTED: 3-hydroxyisobutyryl-CoA hydrolase, mitochondrial-like [Priapulus caudatus]